MKGILSKYLFEIFIVALHFTPIYFVGVIIGSIITVQRVVFASKIDLISIFILLSPAIVFGENKLLYDTNLIIGPLALSTKFSASLSVFPRLVLTFREQSQKKILLLWFLAFSLTCYGTFLAVSMRISSAGGLTVGLRIILSIGALLIPLAMEELEFKQQIIVIAKMSLILYILGLMSGHWYFVTLGIAPFILFHEKSLTWKFLAVLPIFYFFIDSETPFTTSSILYFSFFFLVANKIFHRKNFLKSKLLMFNIWLFPLTLAIIVISEKFIGVLSSIGSQRFLDKLLEDRGILWIFAVELILKSNPFVVPAARDIPTINYDVIGYSDWGPGAHNMILEIMRQNGLLAFILVFSLIGVFFVGKIPSLRADMFFKNLLACLLVIYVINGTVGQAMIYDGQGFLFWLIVGQLVKVCAKNNTKESLAIL